MPCCFTECWVFISLLSMMHGTTNIKLNVEQFTDINKLYIVASCWTIFGKKKNELVFFKLYKFSSNIFTGFCLRCIFAPRHILKWRPEFQKRIYHEDSCFNVNVSISSSASLWLSINHLCPSISLHTHIERRMWTSREANFTRRKSFLIRYSLNSSIILSKLEHC